MLGVAGLLDLRQHVVEHLLVWLPEHDPGVDAGALAPGPLGLVVAQEEDAAVELVPCAVGVAVVHAPAHGGRRGQVEELVDVAAHEEVDVHHEDPLELHEFHAPELGEDLLEAVLLLREAQRAHTGIHVFNGPAVPELRKDLHVVCGHIFGVHADARMPRACPLQRVAQDHGAYQVVRRGTPEADQVCTLPARFLCRRRWLPSLGKVGVHRPLAIGAEAPPAVGPRGPGQPGLRRAPAEGRGLLHGGALQRRGIHQAPLPQPPLPCFPPTQQQLQPRQRGQSS
mmetsp:Transcript_29703/g.85016  ORF Transcript_29703/g.85016 Transcript_29703/m.85016 type:complete len:283 (-) Transcript_29703:29-877(-)